MPVMHSPESAYAREMVQWEATHTQYGPPGRQHEHRLYPTRMYRAGRVNDGPIGIVAGEDAADEVQRSNLEALGFVYGGQQAAIDAFTKQQQEFSELAAARNYEDRNRGDKAKSEVHMHESMTSEHLPAIPETPIVRRQSKA